jgi:hypothetical protein
VFRALVLNKQLDCQYICRVIQDMINKNNDKNGSSQDYVLTFKITKAIDAEVTLPKLEYKPDDNEMCNT